jgi:hypothetical protein
MARQSIADGRTVTENDARGLRYGIQGALPVHVLHAPNFSAEGGLNLALWEEHIRYVAEVEERYKNEHRIRPPRNRSQRRSPLFWTVASHVGAKGSPDAARSSTKKEVTEAFFWTTVTMTQTRKKHTTRLIIIELSPIFLSNNCCFPPFGLFLMDIPAKTCRLLNTAQIHVRARRHWKKQTPHIISSANQQSAAAALSILIQSALTPPSSVSPSTEILSASIITKSSSNEESVRWYSIHALSRKVGFKNTRLDHPFRPPHHHVC